MDVTEDVAATLRAESHGHPPCVMRAAGFCTEHSAQSRSIGYEEETSPTLRAGVVPAVVYENHNRDTRYTDPLETGPEYVVRRLTPTECERLQGFPDGWTGIGDYTDSNGKKKKSSDTARYKALGNSIALPPWRWVLKRLCNQYDRCVTMGSLFDGIGGFPLIWEEINGKGSCLWASEIEEFAIAVTKMRIGG